MSALERLKRDAAVLCECSDRSTPCGQTTVSGYDLRELITAAEKQEAALHAETERGNALAVRVDDAEARFRMADETVATLRAELAGAQSQAAAACRERDAAVVRQREEVDCGQRGVCAKAPGCQRHWAERVDEIIGERDVAHGVAEKAIEELAARDAEVPGLSTTPGYTMDDVDRIEAARGKPYAKLRTERMGVALDGSIRIPEHRHGRMPEARAALSGAAMRPLPFSLPGVPDEVLR